MVQVKASWQVCDWEECESWINSRENRTSWIYDRPRTVIKLVSHLHRSPVYVDKADHWTFTQENVLTAISQTIQTLYWFMEGVTQMLTSKLHNLSFGSGCSVCCHTPAISTSRCPWATNTNWTLYWASTIFDNRDTTALPLLAHWDRKLLEVAAAHKNFAFPILLHVERNIFLHHRGRSSFIQQPCVSPDLDKGWLQVFDLSVQTVSCPKKANTGSVGLWGFALW